MVKYEIARHKAIETWLDITTPRSDPAGAPVTVEVDRLPDVAHARLQAEARQAYIGSPDGLQAHVDAVVRPAATPVMREAAVEAVFPITDSLAALMALVMADLSRSQRETLMNLIFQRGPKSSSENPSWARKSGPRSLIAVSHGVLDEYEGHWVQDEFTGDDGFLDDYEDILWVYDEEKRF